MSLDGGAAGYSTRDAVRLPGGSGAPGAGESAWAGWVVFAGVLLFFAGLLHMGQGVVALVDDDDYYSVGSDGLVIDVDYTVWGVVHLVLGAFACVIGIGLFTGNVIARVAAVVLAGVSALTSLAFLPAQPFWGVIAIGFDLVILYAVLVHGGELAEPEWSTPGDRTARPGSEQIREESS